MSGTFTPTPPAWFVDMARDHFIVPTHPARLIPFRNPMQVAADFVAAVAKTIDNVRAVMAPPPAAPVVPPAAVVAEPEPEPDSEPVVKRKLDIPGMSRSTEPRSAVLLSHGRRR